MQGEPNRGAFYLYVADSDALYKQALSAGATSEREPKDEFWGDRTAMVKDPFGNTWSVATHQEDISPDEMGKRAAGYGPGTSVTEWTGNMGNRFDVTGGGAGCRGGRSNPWTRRSV